MAVRVEVGHRPGGAPKGVAHPSRRKKALAVPTTGLVPAAARRERSTAAPEAELHGEAIEVFALAVGGRRQLVETLAVADSVPEVEQIINLLLDPRYARTSLRRICRFTGLTVAQLFAAYRKALIARAHVQATHIIAERLPPIVEDVMARATPQQVPCSLCHGLGLVNQIEPGQPPVPCPTCHGQRVVLSEPDLDRQKLALELGHLIEKRGGLIVQQNQIAAAATPAAGALEQLQQAVGDLLFAPGRRRALSPEPTADDLPRREPPPLDLPLPIGEGDESGDEDDGDAGDPPPPPEDEDDEG